MNNIWAKIRANPNYSKDASVNWYMTNVRNFAKSTGLGKMQMLGDNQSQLTKKIYPGGMFMFFYDPKGKETLPHYDTFPLVLPFNITPTHFTGLNLHYLHPKTRFVLFDKLQQFATNDRLDDSTKMKLSWALIAKASQFPEIQPCVKKYLVGQVKSHFLWIKPEDWFMTIFLPLESFKKQTSSQVWRLNK